MATLARPRALIAPLPWRTIGLVAALVILLAAAAVFVGSQQRLPPPFGRAANGLVAYSFLGDIYTASAVTGVQTAIVSGPENDYGPRWSRDGTLIAFLRADVTEGKARLFIVRADGEGLQALTPDPFETLDVYEFSPDGNSVLFLSKAPNGLQSISIVGLDGGSRTLDVGRSVHTAAWRPPNGEEILFISEDPVARGLYVAKADGTGLSTLVQPSSTYNLDAALWSPDGTQIAYTRWGGPGVNQGGLSLRVRLISADGESDRPVGMDPQSTWEAFPAWSNDGTRLVIVRGYTGDTDNTALVVVSAADPETEIVSEHRNLTDCCGAHEWAPDDTTIVTSFGGVQQRLDPQTGDTTPVQWAAFSDPTWQRLAP